MKAPGDGRRRKIRRIFDVQDQPACAELMVVDSPVSRWQPPAGLACSIVLESLRWEPATPACLNQQTSLWTARGMAGNSHHAATFVPAGAAQVTPWPVSDFGSSPDSV